MKDSWGDKCSMPRVEYSGFLPPSCSTFTLQKSSCLMSQCMLFTPSCPNLSSCSSCLVAPRSTTITCIQLLGLLLCTLLLSPRTHPPQPSSPYLQSPAQEPTLMIPPANLSISSPSLTAAIVPPYQYDRRNCPLSSCYGSGPQ